MTGKIQTAANNAAARQDTPKTLNGWLGLYKNQIAKALPSVITPERFVRMAMTAASSSPMLQECDPMSFIGAALTAAQLGLEPNTPLGQAYLIPYKNNKKNIVECQFQIGYKGLLDLANRSGLLKNVTAQIVYENDDFEFELGLEPKLKHKPAMSNRGEAQWVYATYHLTNGGYNFEVMSMEDVRNFAKTKSKSFTKGPWQTDFEAMAKKTVLKRVLKYAPLKSEVASAVTNDGGSFELDIKDEDVNIIPVNYKEMDDEGEVVVDTQTGEVISV
ncbi:MAG: recombinase RecT [Clostridiales bacterium]|nr:recombinase RecT [Clostridiales bacterium]